MYELFIAQSQVYYCCIVEIITKAFSYLIRGFGGAMVSMLNCCAPPGSNPAEAFGFFMSVKKSFSMPSFRMGK